RIRHVVHPSVYTAYTRYDFSPYQTGLYLVVVSVPQLWSGCRYRFYPVKSSDQYAVRVAESQYRSGYAADGSLSDLVIRRYDVLHGYALLLLRPGTNG